MPLFIRVLTCLPSHTSPWSTFLVRVLDQLQLRPSVDVSLISMPLSFIFNNRGFEHRTSNVEHPTRKTNDLQASRFLIPDLPSNFDEYEMKAVKMV